MAGAWAWAQLGIPVTWCGINYAGTQITQWDFQSKGTRTSPARLSFGLEVVSQHNLCRTM